MASRYEDEIWELVPDEPEPPPDHLVAFVRGLERADRALDLGCGDGRLTAFIEAGELTAADVSGVALDRARGRLPGVQLVELTPGARLPFADGSFELVTCLETIEHVVDLLSLLSEIRRVLRPGGRLALSAPAHGRVTGARIVLGGFERLFDPHSPHLRFLTRRSLKELLRDGGFTVERVRRSRGTLLAIASR